MVVASCLPWIQTTIASVPEPHLLMLLAGLGLVGAARFSRQRA